MMRRSNVLLSGLAMVILLLSGCDGGLTGGVDVPIGSPDITIEQGDVIVNVDQTQDNDQAVDVAQDQETDVEQGQEVNQDVDQEVDTGDHVLPDVECFTHADCGEGEWCIGGECVEVECLSDADCDDGLFCNGVEICVGFECLSGESPCADDEVCDEEADTCILIECEVDDDCDDGDLCTTDECIDYECIFTPIECSEGEVCDPDTGECVAIGCESDADCDDGLFCNGEETCNIETAECVAGENPCTPCDICDEDNDVCPGPPVDHSYVHRIGGELNGHPIDGDHYEIWVAPGEQIIGSIVVETHNGMGPGSVAPLGWTVDWGLRQDQPRLIDDWIPTETSDHQVPIDVAAPEELGDYHVIIAFAGRYTIDQVMSETKQDVPENPVWYDGNDVGFDWSERQFEVALNDGVVCSSFLYLYPDGYGHHWLPATVVVVHVIPGQAEKIIFSARIEQGDQADIYCMNPDGTGLVNLTLDFDADTARLAVSPDGTRIAFSAGDPLRGIWVMNADGTDKTEVVAGLVDTPRWFDNDTVFYVLTLTSQCPFPGEIRSIQFDGTTWTNDTLVVSNAVSIGQNTTETFDISPDGSMLVWNAQIGCWSPSSDIYKCDLEGTVCDNIEPFYTDAGDDQMDVLPIWSPDGQTVYWAHDITPGVETATAIVKKAIDSSVPVTEYDEVVRPAGECGLELSGLFAVAPDDSKLLLFLPAGYGLYTWDLALPGDCDTLLLSADYVRDAYWGLLASDL